MTSDAEVLSTEAVEELDAYHPPDFDKLVSSHEALRRVAESAVFDRDGLTVLDIALSHLADIVRRHPDTLPTAELKLRAMEMHNRVLALKRGDV